MVCDLEEYARGCLVVFTCRSVQTSLRCVATYPQKLCVSSFESEGEKGEEEKEEKEKENKNNTCTRRAWGPFRDSRKSDASSRTPPPPATGALRSATLGEPPSAALQQTPDQHTDNSRLCQIRRSVRGGVESQQQWTVR